jgi:hypothetical protein
MALGSTQPLPEMITRNLTGGKGRPARKANNLTAICEPTVQKNEGSSTSQNPMGLHVLLQGQFYLFTFILSRYTQSLFLLRLGAEDESNRKCAWVGIRVSSFAKKNFL